MLKILFNFNFQSFMSEYISKPTIPNSIENPNSSELELNSSQIAEVRKFLGQENQNLLKFKEQNLPKAIGLVDLKNNGKFECNLLISKPLVYGSKW